MSTDLPSDPMAGQVVIVNPSGNQATLAYSINGQPFNLPPGGSQQLDATSAMVIEFDRGMSGDPARYSLTPGTYTFAATDQGWNLTSGPVSTSDIPGLVAGTSQTGPASNVPQFTASAGIRRN